MGAAGVDVDAKEWNDEDCVAEARIKITESGRYKLCVSGDRAVLLDLVAKLYEKLQDK